MYDSRYGDSHHQDSSNLHPQLTDGDAAEPDGAMGDDTVHEEWSDQTLYQGLRQHDLCALEALIQRYAREMTYYIRVVLAGIGTTQDAEECANDLFVVAWREIESLDPARGTLRAWLSMRAKFLALDKRRQLARRGVTVSLDVATGAVTALGEESRAETLPSTLIDNSIEQVAERHEQREVLNAMLRALSDTDRTLVYLRYLNYKTPEEISATTGLTRHSIDTKLWRARKVMREALTAIEGQGNERTRALRRP